MRALFLLTALPLLAAAPALGQSAVDSANKRIRSVVVYGDEVCPESKDPDEIVVCARRPEEERYRLAPSQRDAATKNRKNRAWGARAAELNTLGKTGTGTCTPVGPGGDTGCTLQMVKDAAEERADAKAEAADAPKP